MKRTLALDVGSKTIGVAVSDLLGITANGVTTIMRKDMEHDTAELAKIIAEYEPGELLVGLPMRSDGGMTRRGEEIKKFTSLVLEKFGIPISFWDESYSTKNAERFLIEADVSRKKRKKVIDKMAAVYILAEYLETKRPISSEDDY